MARVGYCLRFRISEKLTRKVRTHQGCFDKGSFGALVSWSLGIAEKRERERGGGGQEQCLFLSTPIYFSKLACPLPKGLYGTSLHGGYACRLLAGICRFIGLDSLGY